MARIIPKNTKIKTQFYKNLTFGDAVVLLIGLIIVALIAISGLGIGSILLAIFVGLIVMAMMFETAPDTRLYHSIGSFFKFIFGAKTFSKSSTKKQNNITTIIPYKGVINNEEDNVALIDYGDYYGAVIEIKPVEFYMLSEARQNSFINAIDNAFKVLGPEHTVAIYKTEKPLVLDHYIEMEENKGRALIEATDRKVFTEEELDTRLDVIETRINGLENCNVGTDDMIMKEHYYMVIYAGSKQGVSSTATMVASSIEGTSNGSISCKILDKPKIISFLKSAYTSNFDERETSNLTDDKVIDWIAPNKIQIKSNKVVIDGQAYNNFTIADYPVAVRNAWGNYFFNIPGSRVCVKFKPVNIDAAEKRIDRAIMEMETKLRAGGKSSKVLANQTHLETLNELLASIKNGNEAFFDTSIYIVSKEESKKNVKMLLRRGGFKFSDNFGTQFDSFVNFNVSRRMSMSKFERGINSSSLAAVFPFISDAVQDENGFFLGYNSEPFFIDFFRRDAERINSNMVILGKSGSGKSYATKGLLTHLASDNSKIYILDPEKEYDILAKNLGGKVIDVGSAKEGRLNPFHVVASLEDEGSEGTSTALAAHLQFLEEFFKLILDGITKDALEVLNECVRQVYENFDITNTTKLDTLKAEDYPTFQDLFNYVSKAYTKTKDEFLKSNLRVIGTYLNKFAEGGRNSMLWNGYSTITSEQNFIVFNFQSLLANKNPDIANAQMLLVMRWLENEIIKNKDYNAKYKTKRRVIVAIDEAHVFIDPKKDVALDFMFQMAKRIRKYEGMLLVITQNIKDFVGTPEIARKSTAIINACQYSMIFSLAPHDINDLVALYEKAGKINESEQEAIISNPRGRAFIITGPYSRTNVEVTYAKPIVETFEKDLRELRREMELESVDIETETVPTEQNPATETK